MKLILLVVCGALIWGGFDGLRVNMSGSELAHFSIDDVEGDGIGDARYISVSGGVLEGTMVYEYDQKSGKVKSLIFPVVSRDNLFELMLGKGSAPMLYIERSPVPSGCVEENTFCLEDEDVEAYNGIVRVGLDSLDSESRELFTGNGIEVPDNAIFLDENAKPREAWSNALMMLLGIVGLVLMFRPKRGKEEPEPEAG